MFGSNKEVVSFSLWLLLDPRQIQMAFAFGFPRDVTKLVASMWDWRYRLVRGGGKTPSAAAMPLPVPEFARLEPITTNMKHGQFYIQRIEAYVIDAGILRGPVRVNIKIWEGYTPRHSRDFDRRAGWPIKSFDRCSSKDVRPCNFAALWSTCDACEPVKLQLQRTHL